MNDEQPRRPSRRTVLRWIGAGAGALVVGGLAARAGYQGMFAPRTGPAYEAWQEHATGVEGLVAAAVLAASAHNMQNWRFAPGPGVLDVSDDPTRGLGVVDPHRREAQLGVGCAVANAEVAAPALGYAARLVVRPDGADPDLLARLVLTEAPPAAPDDLAAAIPRRHSDRGPYPADEPSRDLLDEVREVALAGARGVDLVWVTKPAARDRLGTLLVDAAQALVDDDRMSIDNAELVRYDHGVVEREKDGLTMDAQGMSSLLAFLAQMAPATPRHQADASWVKSTRDVHTATARAYGLVVGPRDDVAARVHAGRALQRLHLALVARGWAMHHMNQAVEMAERDVLTGTPDRFDAPLTGLAGGQVMTMVRVGRPSGRAVPSPRRPVSEVLV
jgi:nitroreductase